MITGTRKFMVWLKSKEIKHIPNGVVVLAGPSEQKASDKLAWGEPGDTWCMVEVFEDDNAAWDYEVLENWDEVARTQLLSDTRQMALRSTPQVYYPIRHGYDS